MLPPYDDAIGTCRGARPPRREPPNRPPEPALRTSSSARAGEVVSEVTPGATEDPRGAPSDDRDATSRRGPWPWTVTWGVLARPGFVVEHVVAFDVDEALVLAAERRPDLPPPVVAFLTAPRSARS